MRKILVIKHGALGDVVLATGPFQAIRQHHKDDHITLLTTPPYADMLRTSGYFDEIWIDTRPKLYNVFAFFKLIGNINRGGFSRIYDMQTSERTSWYFKMLRNPKPEWVGTAEGASHRHNTPERTTLHTVERQKQQLAIAGIPKLPKPNIDWLTSNISRFALPARFALIAAGGSSHRPGKRWPASHYGVLCNWLVEKNITPILIGTQAEASVLSTIEAMCPTVRNLLGQTNFADIATLARSAVCAVGNDTGPIHLIATTGCHTLVLFSQFSDPALCVPRGTHVSVMREACLATLLPEAVIQQVSKLL
jgi:ADP-heptose:LPS heptosyltransferase